jgi:hypothetical protein
LAIKIIKNNNILFLIVFVLISSDLLYPQWPKEGITIRGVNSNIIQSYEPVISSDGEGGAFVAWNEYRTSDNRNIFVQHIAGNGQIKLDVDGKKLTDDSYNTSNVSIVDDDFGGAFLAWVDSRGGIYTQRINSAGQIYWNVNGVKVSDYQGEILHATKGIENNLILLWVVEINYTIKKPALVRLKMYDNPDSKKS